MYLLVGLIVYTIQVQSPTETFETNNMTWMEFLADFSICVPAQKGGCAACVLPEFGKIFVVPLGHDYVLDESLSQSSWVAYSGIVDDRAGAEIN